MINVQVCVQNLFCFEQKPKAFSAWPVPAREVRLQNFKCSSVRLPLDPSCTYSAVVCGGTPSYIGRHCLLLPGVLQEQFCSSCTPHWDSAYFGTLSLVRASAALLGDPGHDSISPDVVLCTCSTTSAAAVHWASLLLMDAARDYLFCPATGALLHLDAARDVARCPLSGWQKSLQGAEQRTCSSAYSSLLEAPP